ncbi:FG-GAP repeat protein [Chiayiivirga flava]|uniref:Integrin n=1 Tax=Chiayiivirga flava TaxID=659595 RepID=A0A7W8D3N9_9GAMM|nr:FG-GAP repeat protein [Chiayiivirga flava]MBB5206892.1 hypothetical protein [Chiayiivirga flava]
MPRSLSSRPRARALHGLLWLGIACGTAAAVEPLRAPASEATGDAGYAVAVAGGWVAVGIPGDDDGAGAVDLFDCRTARCVATQRLHSADPDPERRFGAALALDATTLAVGEPGDGRGAAEVFVRSGDIWSRQARLSAFDGDNDDAFGIALALDGDTLLVGAAGAEQAQGAAYAFERSGGTWMQAARIDSGDGERGDRFGTSVALHGDTALVGAPLRTAAAPGTAHGAAYVFTRGGGTWKELQTLQSTTPLAGETFGWSVALGSAHAAVGAPRADAQRGAIDVFAGTPGAMVWAQRLDDAGALPGQRLGWSLALAGDTLVGGAPFAGTDAAAHCGRALRFVRDGSAWSAAPLADGQPAATELAGWSVASNGVDTIIGAPAYARPGQPHAGIARRLGGDLALFSDDYEQPDPACGAP